MAKRRSRKGKLNIQHFRGLHEFPRTDERTFTRYINGLIDDPAGDLARLGGKVCFGSNPLGSVWSINQVRFKGNWGIVVQNTSSRIWYDHDEYKGPEDGILTLGDPPGADAQVSVIPGQIVPGDKDGDPTRPGIVDPINCHSDLQFRRGIWQYPVTDLRVCYRARGWTVYATDNDPCTAIEKAYNAYRVAYLVDPWGPWLQKAASDPAVPMPSFVSRVRWNVASQDFQANVGGGEYQYSLRSDELASPPSSPVGTYRKATGVVSGSIGGFNLDDFVGEPDAALSVACGSGDMPIGGTTIGHYSLADAKGHTSIGSMRCENVPQADSGVWKSILIWQPTYDPDETKVILMSEGGLFSSVWSHFES